MNNEPVNEIISCDCPICKMPMFKRVFREDGKVSRTNWRCSECVYFYDEDQINKFGGLNVKRKGDK